MKKLVQIFFMLLVGLLASPLAKGQSKPFVSGWTFTSINDNPTQWKAYTQLRSKVHDAYGKGKTFFFEGSPTQAEVDRVVFPFKGSNTLAGQFYLTFASESSPNIPFIMNYGYQNQEDDRRFHFQKVTVAFGDYIENETDEKPLSSRDVTYDCNIFDRDCRVYQTHSFNFDRSSVWANAEHSFAKSIIIRYYMDNKVAKTLILPVLVLGDFKKYLSTGPGPIELYAILRAMPGDQSSTFLEKNETISSEVTMGIEESNSNSSTVTVSASAGFSAGPFSAKTEVEASTTTTHTQVNGRENTYNVDFNVSEIIENDNSEDDFSDKFIAIRRQYDYGIEYLLNASTNNATDYVLIKAKTKMLFYPLKEKEEKLYETEKTLLNTTIPELEAEKKFAEANFWKQLIRKNDSLKVLAKKRDPDDIFTAKTNGQKEEASTARASSLTISQEVSIEKSKSLSISAEGGFSGFGVDASASVKAEKTWTFTSTTSSSNTNGKSNVITTGYQLMDDDFTFGDRFKIKRWNDPATGSSVWELDESSVTSLPYEGGIAADQPDFYVIDPITGEEVTSAKFSDIPEGEEVTFDVVLKNKYQGSGRNYNIRFNPNQGDTPDYRFAGGGFGGVSPVFEIGPGASFKTRIRIRNPDKKPQPFKDMMFIMNPERALPDDQNSDGYVSDTIFLSAFYGATDTDRVPNNNFVGGAVLLPTDGSLQTSYIGVDDIEFPITTKNATSTEQEQALVPSNWEPEVDGKPVIDNSVWFKFIATTPRIRISMKHDVNDGFDFQLAAYKTTNISNTSSYSRLGSTDLGTGIELNNLTVGETIYILIDGFKGAQSDFGISVDALAPVNDDGCSATLISARGVIVTGFTNVAATIQENEEFLIPASNDPSTGWVDQDIRHSVWFKFAAPAVGEAVIDVLNATFDSQIIVLEQSRTCHPDFFSQYTHVGANDAVTLAGGLDSRITLKGLIPGQSYGFIVDGFEGETGTFDIRISSPIPFNDEPETAIELVIDAAGQGVFTNAGSTSSDEEQVISPPTVPLNKPGGWSDVEGDSRARRIERSVWFKFKAPAEGAVKISTCDQENFFLQMALYKIGDLADYSTYELLGADDESQFCRRPPSNESPNGRNIRGSIMNLTGLIPDETYYLIVDGSLNSFGQFSIDLLTTPITDPPANDKPCDAIELPVNGEVQTGYKNFAATPDKSKTGYDITPSEWLDDDMGGTVWFTFTGPNSGEVEISTCDMANFDTQLAVFTLTGCEIDSNAVLMGANEDGPKNCATDGDSYLTIKNLTPGQKYYLVVDGYGANKGNFNIVLRDQITPGPANDEVTNAIELPVNGEVQTGYTNTYATVKDSEQNIRPKTSDDQDCTTGWCDNQVDNSVWFKFVVPADGKVNISTCDLADFDTQLALYAATDVSDFSTFTLQAANDAGPDDCSTFYDSYLPVTGLNAGETYYIMVDGFDGDNGAFSISLTGVADVLSPSSPSDLSSSNITTESADVSWTAASDNVAVTEYEVYVDGTSVGKTANTTFSLSSLSASTSYTVKVVALDAAGNSSTASADLTITTEKGADSQAPTSPTGLTTTDIRATGVDISWTAATDDESGIKEYKVYIDGALVATVSGTTFSVSGLTEGAAYSIYVVAVDNAGNESAASTALKLTTGTAAVVDTESPSTPTGLTAGTITDNSIAVSWSAATDNVGITDYEVYVDGALTATVSSTSHTITGLSSAAAYSIQVKAKDAAGNVSDISTSLKVTTATTAVVDTESPSTPTGLTAGTITDNSIAISWSAATDNVGTTGYEIYVDGVLTATVSGTSHTITGLSKAAAYSIQVKAKDAAGNVSDISTSLKVTTLEEEILGIWNEAVNASYKVYPNPFSNRVVLEYPGLALKQGSVEIRNIIGKVLYVPKLNNKSERKVEIDLTPLPSGALFLIIKKEEELIFRKLIKE